MMDNKYSSKELADMLLILNKAVAFRNKVKRDAPTCFVPSAELKALFDALEEAGV
jgi:hypothetical protein